MKSILSRAPLVVCLLAALVLVVSIPVVPVGAADGDDPAARRRPFLRLLHDVAGRYGVDPRLLDAIIRTESSYRSSAVSPAGAVGLMQLMPATARRYGVRNRYDPVQNVVGGTAYLADLLSQFGLVDAIAAYNAGEAAVRRHGGVPPYVETRRYVVRVLERYLGGSR